MKLHKALGFLICIGLVPFTLYAATVAVRYGTVLTTLGANYHGINFVGSTTWFPATGSAGSREAFKRAGVQIIRYPGGVLGDYYNWKSPSGSSCLPFTQVLSYAQAVGAQVMFETNAGGASGSPQTGAHAAAWYDSCVKLGFGSLVPVWEVGNEPELWTNRATGTYKDIFHDHAVALHAKNANLKVIGAATANAYISNDMYKAYPNDPNGFSFHWYGGGGWTVMREAAQSEWPYYAQYHATFNTKNMPFYVTEWSPLGATTGDVSNDFNKTVGAALCYMDMIGAFQRTGVDGYTMFGCNIQVEDNWGILCSSMDYRALDMPGPVYFTLPMWTKTGPMVLPTVNSEDSALVMSTYANKKSDGSVQVFLINKAAARSVTVSFQGYNPTGATVSIYEFRPASAGNVAAQNWYYNNVSDANLRPATTDLPAPPTETCSGTTYTRSLPAYSATMLDFKGGTVNGVKLRYDRVAPGISVLQTDRSIRISITGTWDVAVKSICIYNLDGKLVSSIPAQSNQKEFSWNAAGVKTGTYAIRAQTGSSIFTKSFCVKN